MIVVADTSLFVALANIGQLDLLPRLFGRVLIPPQVLDELQSPKRPGTVRAFVATPPEWLEVQAPMEVEPIPDLHVGETAAISLARECHAELLVTDETQGERPPVTEGSRSPEPSASSKPPLSGGLSASKTNSSGSRGWASGSIRSSWMLGSPCSEKGGTSQKRPRGRTRNRNHQKSKERNRDRGHEQ